MTPSDDQLKFESFYKTNQGYLTILNSLVDTGQLKDITVYGLGVLVVLKRYTHLFKTSVDASPYPSLTKISKVSGISVSKVKSTIKMLDEKGYIKRVDGTDVDSNRWMVNDRYFSASQKAGEPDKLVDQPYIPARRKKTQDELNFWDREGEVPAGAKMVIRPVIIENLNITYIQNNNQGDVVNVVPQYAEVKDQKKIPVWLKDKVKEFEASLSHPEQQIEESNDDDSDPE